MDEIVAHLDADRRAALFDEICSIGAQAWMTGTDRTLFNDLGDRAQYFHVENATFTEFEDRMMSSAETPFPEKEMQDR